MTVAEAIDDYHRRLCKICKPPVPNNGVFLYSGQFRRITQYMFYFYTFYWSEAYKKSKTFFTSMLPDLCGWHRNDTVDSTEVIRSMAIVRIQSNANPFVFDPSLAERCYCKKLIPDKSHAVNINPNPSKGVFYIEISDYQGQLVMNIYSDNCKLISTDHLM